ncbi:MAG: 3'-5' exonuclease, partial [Ginsengibacter sp.]
LFPSAMSINTREELEEERRLFYVAVTRAKYKLWLTYANTRYRFGNLTQNDPSRFINELPEERLDRAFAGGNMRNNQNSHWNPFDKIKSAWKGPVQDDRPRYTDKPAYVNTTATIKIREHVPSADFSPSDTSNLQEGQKVEHQKFGFGEVIKMEGAAHNPIATVKFEFNGEKKIMLNYARLRVIN